MNRSINMLAAIAATLLTLCSCSDRHAKDGIPALDNYSRVLLLWSEGYNNLSSNLVEDIDDLCSGNVPSVSDSAVLLVFSHASVSNWNRSTPTEPVLIRIYEKKGAVVRDTLTRYGSESVTASAEMLTKIWQRVSSDFPSEHYGMVYSSHGTSWIPSGYSDESSILLTYVGVQSDETSSTRYSVNIDDFAAALPVKLDYIIFDACLMSAVEVMYELRDVCRYIVAAPTEILTQGFVYKTMPDRLLLNEEPDLKGVCIDFFNQYRESSGTVALLDCSAAEDLAAVCRDIFEAHRISLLSVNRYKIQSYNYSLGDWFYDLKDYCRVGGADEAELDSLQAVLDRAVPFKATTTHFLSTRIDTTRYSGLSSYVPSSDWPKLNEWYKQLAWNQAAELLK